MKSLKINFLESFLLCKKYQLTNERYAYEAYNSILIWRFIAFSQSSWKFCRTWLTDILITYLFRNSKRKLLLSTSCCFCKFLPSPTAHEFQISWISNFQLLAVYPIPMINFPIKSLSKTLGDIDDNKFNIVSWDDGKLTIVTCSVRERREEKGHKIT